MSEKGQPNKDEKRVQRPSAAQPSERIPYNVEKMKAAGVTAIAGFMFSASQYKKSLAILLLNVVAFSFMAYQTYFIMHYKPPVKYIPIYEDSTIIDPVPLTEPFKSDAEISQWIADASKDIFSYGYLDADTHGERVKKYFTEKGFADYISTFSASPDRSRVINKKLQVLASVIGSPSKTHKGFKLSGNSFAYWEYRFTVRQVFVSTTEGIIPVTYDMVATIVRQDQRLYRDGIAIHSLRVVSSSNIK